MTRRLLGPALGLTLLTASATLWSEPSPHAPPTTAAAAEARPADGACSWRLPLPERSAGVRLRVRQQSLPHESAATRRAAAPAMAMRPTEAERTAKTGTITAAGFEGETTAVAIVRLPDPAGPQRLRASLSIAGVSTQIPDVGATLPAGRIVGEAAVPSAEVWRDGELYLMSFRIDGDDGRDYRFDVLLESKPAD